MKTLGKLTMEKDFFSENKDSLNHFFAGLSKAEMFVNATPIAEDDNISFSFFAVEDCDDFSHSLEDKVFFGINEAAKKLLMKEQPSLTLKYQDEDGNGEIDEVSFGSKNGIFVVNFEVIEVF